MDELNKTSGQSDERALESDEKQMAVDMLVQNPLQLQIQLESAEKQMKEMQPLELPRKFSAKNDYKSSWFKLICCLPW